LPSAPRGYILNGGTADVEHANASRPAVPGILQQQRGYAMILGNIRTIHLILAPHIFQQLGYAIVMCRDPACHRV
jgi:hypothetical protein